MNWLYPNFLRRIDHYLKINYPHIWRTRVHDFGWFSLVLGNVLAFVLGMLVVGRDNILNEDNIMTLHGGLAVLLGFVGLFWAMRLLRFKMKFSNFKTMLATWVIYALCVASLGLNLATFTSSIAYRTACIYSDEVADYDYFAVNGLIHTFNYGTTDERPYERYILKPEYVTDDLLMIMQRRGYEIDTTKAILKSHIETVGKSIKKYADANFFLQQPVTRSFGNLSGRTAYHKVLMRHWMLVIKILFFLPTILFLISKFGIKNILISSFCTGLIVGLADLTMEPLGLTRAHMMSGQGREWTVYAFIIAILMFTLLIGRHRLQSWNYIAGVFMLMIAVVFLKSPTLFTKHLVVMKPEILHYNPWMTQIGLLSVSLIVSLIAAWLITKRNYQPVLWNMY